jgi:hypothetical protein
MVRHLVAVAFVFVCASAAWIGLATVVALRTDGMGQINRQHVEHLWGSGIAQEAPTVVVPDRPVPIPLTSSKIHVDLALEHRKKGLLWYSTYDVQFRGQYTVHNDQAKPLEAELRFELPSPGAIYDSFELKIDEQRIEAFQIVHGRIRQPITIAPGQSVQFSVSYQTQGSDRWHYVFGVDAQQVRHFELAMNTNFKAIDFPDEAISPRQKTETETGWALIWSYDNLLSGVQIGMTMPARLNPGPWVTRLTYSAPISLFLFFFLMLIITTLRGIRMHAVNYFFLATAFFSYHLLLSYLVDHVSIHVAFWMSSAVSVFLVISYMRLVVGMRFAMLETGLSQFVFLVLFSYTFFFEGYTGLTITILCIVTLFIVMQATGRLDWSKVFEGEESAATA